MLAAAGYLVLEAIAAAGFQPSYSYPGNYISDLGATSQVLIGGRMSGSPRASVMHAAFFLQGALFLLGALLIIGVPRSRRARVFLGFVAANALGNIIIGAVHSGRVHVIGAAMAIVGGNAAILAGSAVIGTLGQPRWYRRISSVLAVVGFLSLAMLMVNSATGTRHLLPNGAWERGSVYSITTWQLLTAAILLTAQHQRPRD